MKRPLAAAKRNGQPVYFCKVGSRGCNSNAGCITIIPYRGLVTSTSACRTDLGRVGNEQVVSLRLGIMQPSRH